MAAALITGAGGGLGRAIAVRLAAEGHPIAALDVDERGLAKTVQAVEAGGGQALALLARLPFQDGRRHDLGDAVASVIIAVVTLAVTELALPAASWPEPIGSWNAPV